MPRLTPRAVLLAVTLAHAAAAGADGGSAARATHVHLAVTNVTKSTAFYRDMLGLKLQFATEQIAFFDLGTFQLLLGPGHLVRPAKVAGVEEGITVGFEVDDVDATYAQLKAKGCEIARPPKDTPYTRNFFVRDPDGYTIEYERTPPHAQEKHEDAATTAGEWTNGVEYAAAGGEHQLMDVFVPAGAAPHAGVVVVHGGGFVMGDRRVQVRPILDVLTQAGFAVFTIDYRLAPKHRYPAAVEDVEAAVRYVRAHAAHYGVDPARLALLGESAGGYLASLVGARSSGETRVAAVVAFYGAHDQEARARAAGKLADSTKAFYGLSDVQPAALATLRAASPVRFVKRGMPPFLLIHGTADAEVPYEQSVAMCAAMTAAGARCELFTVEGAPHNMLVWEKDPAQQKYKAAVLTWLKRELSH